MVYKSIYWLAAIALLATGWKLVDSCSCLPDHPQNQYCRSDYALIGTPKGKTLDATNSSVIFTFKIYDILKANRAAKQALSRGKIYTALDSAQCGVDLTINKAYIILGSVYNGQASINLCNFISPYASLTKTQREGFQGEYRQNCGCTVDLCFISNCTKIRTSCVYNTTLDNSLYCYSGHGICSQNRRGRCDWFENRKWADSTPLVKCLNTTALYV